MEFSHKSVLLEETIENLQIKEDGIYVDGTLGGAGHAVEICKRLKEHGGWGCHKSGCQKTSSLSG